MKQLVIQQMMSSPGKIYNDADALDMCLQMARGLKYLHNCLPMVLHRDLKLENVLLKGAWVVDVWSIKSLGLFYQMMLTSKATVCMEFVFVLASQAARACQTADINLGSSSAVTGQFSGCRLSCSLSSQEFPVYCAGPNSPGHHDVKLADFGLSKTIAVKQAAIIRRAHSASALHQQDAG